MKRSEALKLIEGLFQLELDLYPKHNPTEIFAENLLCHIEETIGMLPPKAWVITNPDNPNFPELKYVKEYVNEWEEE